MLDTMSGMHAREPSPAPFPNPTAWSVVLNARDPNSPERRRHLDRLFSTYWKPVYWALIRSWRLEADDAADLAQEFFLQLSEEGSLKEASPERGRFRTFLRLKLHSLVVDELRRRSSLKRGGDRRFVPIDAGKLPEPELAGLSPEERFDRDWAFSLMNEAIRTLESGLKVERHETAFEAFRLCALVQPPKTYRECADDLGIKESDVRNYVFRTRARLRDVLRHLVRESVENDAEAAEELSYLLGIFNG